MSAAPEATMSTETDPDEGDEPTRPSVLILGTAHVVPLRAAIQHHIFEFDPNAIALELDQARLQGLLADPEDREKAGFGYGLIAKFQESVAEDLGGEVGEEMLAAREAGMLLGLPIALVDKPAPETLKRLMSEMGWIERIKLFGSIAASFLPGRGFEEELQRALDGDPELIEEVTERFPTVKRVLIDERDEHMAQQVLRLVHRFDRVVLVVGDAHVPGILERLEGRGAELDAIRVKELREHGSTGSTVSFQLEGSQFQVDQDPA